VNNVPLYVINVIILHIVIIVPDILYGMKIYWNVNVLTTHYCLMATVYYNALMDSTKILIVFYANHAYQIVRNVLITILVMNASKEQH